MNSASSPRNNPSRLYLPTNRQFQSVAEQLSLKLQRMVYKSRERLEQSTLANSLLKSQIVVLTKMVADQSQNQKTNIKSSRCDNPETGVSLKIFQQSTTLHLSEQQYRDKCNKKVVNPEIQPFSPEEIDHCKELQMSGVPTNSRSKRVDKFTIMTKGYPSSHKTFKNVTQIPYRFRLYS